MDSPLINKLVKCCDGTVAKIVEVAVTLKSNQTVFHVETLDGENSACLFMNQCEIID